MFVRISFVDGQRMTRDELSNLEEFMMDEVSFVRLCKTEDGSITRFYSYLHSTEDKEDKQKVEIIHDVELTDESQHICNLPELLEKFPHLQVIIRSTAGSGTYGPLDLVKSLKDAERELRKLMDAMQETAGVHTVQEVHMGESSLMKVSEIDRINSADVTEVNMRLRDGWRIIMVFGSTGGNPNYILGR